MEKLEDLVDLMDHLTNMIDIVGNKALGLSESTNETIAEKKYLANKTILNSNLEIYKDKSAAAQAFETEINKS
jgi:hypothetical protein